MEKQKPDFDHKVFRKLGQWIDHVVNFTNEVVSSRLYYVLFILATGIFMGSQFIVKHPLDPPTAFFPLTVLLYTLIGLWVENGMKVYQREQGEVQAAQMRLLLEQSEEIHDLSERLIQNDERQRQALVIITKIAESSLVLLEKILDVLEDPDEDCPS